jgi:hypothetical protein
MGLCVLRVVALGLVLGATAVLAAGCASNAASASDAAGVQPEARVFAGGVNLRASDLPGFKALVGLGETGPGPLDRRVEACDGGPFVNAAGRGVVSPLFQQQGAVQTLFSEVYPMRGPSVALGYIAAADSRRGVGCIRRDELRKRDRLPAGVPRRRIEVSALHPALGGAPVSGVRVWRCLAAPQPCSGRRVRSFIDRLWFATGPYVVMLGFVAGPSNEAKAQQALLPVEHHLLALLYSRAQARQP